MLGVVEDNKAAYAFWQQMGFTLHSQKEPHQFGKKLQAVCVMRRSLVANALVTNEDNSITI